MPENIYLEIDENDNSEYMPMQVFEALADPVPVGRVRLFEPGREHGVYEVTGWSSERDGSPCPAMYAPVSDSGQAEAYLVFGGDWGIRFKSEGSTADWDTANGDQWGEPFLALTDRADILLDQ